MNQTVPSEGLSRLAAALPGGGGASLVSALSEALEPDAILSRIVEQALVLLPGAEGTVVELVEGDDLVYVSASGSLKRSIGATVPVRASLSGQCVASNQILSSDDTESDDRVDRGACRRVGARSMVCVPLWHGSGPVGVLKAASSRPGAFTPRDVQLLSRLAEFIATTVAAASEFSRMMARVVRQPGPTSGQTAPDADDDDVAGFIANVLRVDVPVVVDLRRRVESVLDEGSFEILYQPIVNIRTGRLFGAEALARFTTMPYRPPNEWFSEAERVGLGVELELAAVKAALTPLPFLPEHIRVSINVGPEAIVSADLTQMVAAAGPDRVILELTEHLAVEDYPTLNAHLRPLRQQNTFLAIDDTGAGISSLTHVLKLAPDVIKLDREITSGIDFDPVRRALTSALVAFAAESGALVVAEGIETAGELTTLCDLGVVYGQGFHLGRPGPSSALRSYDQEAAPAIGR
ncbi:MAG TPA: EAL domain-containing protein [Acidimicrobiales bacterium]|nr:EAL domain-containing protein [Acidimicrobiales bacterium]